jgi:hypothetical protein
MLNSKAKEKAKSYLKLFDTLTYAGCISWLALWPFRYTPMHPCQNLPALRGRKEGKKGNRKAGPQMFSKWSQSALNSLEMTRYGPKIVQRGLKWPQLFLRRY